MAVDDLELVQYHPEEDESCSEHDTVNRRRRRRRKRGGKKKTETPTVTAADILCRAATECIESSPSSFVSGINGRKMSALELDEDLICEPAHQVLTSTTGTPGSLDSSRSLWELGTIDADEDEILSLGVVTPRPIISSIRMQSLDTEFTDNNDLDSLTKGIDSLLQSIPSLSGKGRDLSRLCLGGCESRRPASNRMCIDNVPRIDFSAVTDFFGSLRDQVGSLGAKLIESQFAQPEAVSSILQSLSTQRPSETKDEPREEGIIPSSSIPVLNRRQRRAIEQKRI